MPMRQDLPDLLPVHRHDHRPLPRFHVALQVEHLLPGAQHELPAADRNRQRWPLDRRLEVRVSVAVVPGLFVQSRGRVGQAGGGRHNRRLVQNNEPVDSATM